MMLFHPGDNIQVPMTDGRSANATIIEDDGHYLKVLLDDGRRRALHRDYFVS